MRPEELLGLPLEEALRRWTEAGFPVPTIRETADPRGGHGTGTLRVIRAAGTEWVTARFLDGDPRRETDREKEAPPCPPRE